MPRMRRKPSSVQLKALRLSPGSQREQEHHKDDAEAHQYGHPAKGGSPQRVLRLSLVSGLAGRSAWRLSEAPRASDGV